MKKNRRKNLKLNKVTVAELQRSRGGIIILQTYEQPPCETMGSAPTYCDSQLDCTARNCPSYDITGCLTTVSLCIC